MSGVAAVFEVRQPPEVDTTTTTRRSSSSTDLTIVGFPELGDVGKSDRGDQETFSDTTNADSADTTVARDRPEVTTPTVAEDTTAVTVVSADLVPAPAAAKTGDTLTIAALAIAAASLFTVVLLAAKLRVPQGSHGRASGRAAQRGDGPAPRLTWDEAAHTPAPGAPAEAGPVTAQAAGGATVAARQPMVASVRASAVSDSGQLPDHVLRVGGSGVAFDAGAGGALHVRAASVRGASHAKKGIINQDGYLIVRRNTGTLVAIADGVSNSNRSEEAVLATLEAVARIVTDRTVAQRPRIIDEIAASVAHTVPASAVDRGPACTLVFALVEPAGQALHVHAAGVGDSSLLVADERGVTVVGGGGDIPGAPTAAVPRDLRGAWQRAVSIPIPCGLLLCTDGFGEAAEKIPAVRSEVATWAAAPDQWQVAATCDYRFSGYGDDRTVVGVWSDQAPAT